MSDNPNFEGFSRDILSDWPVTDIDGFELFDLAVKHKLIQEIPGGFDPEKHEDHLGISPEKGDPWYRYSFNMVFDYFVTTVPRLTIGQQVKVTCPEYQSEWPDPVIVTGIEFCAVLRDWNISIMPKNEIESRCGSTDGWSESDLTPYQDKEDE